MAVYRVRPCTKCHGRGYVNSYTENSVSSYTCPECNGYGSVQTPITNNERLNETTPEEKLKFFRGFVRNAKYGDTPLRLLNPEERDEDMLIWLNKVSDDKDDFIFENR